MPLPAGTHPHENSGLSRLTAFLVMVFCSLAGQLFAETAVDPDFATAPVLDVVALHGLESRAFDGARLVVYNANREGTRGSQVWAKAALPASIADPSSMLTASTQSDAAALAALRSLVDLVPQEKDVYFLVTVELQDKKKTVWTLNRLCKLSKEGTTSVEDDGFLFKLKSGEQEEHWVKGSARSLTLRDSQMRTLREERFSTDAAPDSYTTGLDDGSGASERITYEYGQNQLYRSLYWETGGVLDSIVRYSYTLDGRVRQTDRVYRDGRSERFLFRYGGAIPESYWDSDGLNGLRWVFDSQGRELAQETWKSGELSLQVKSSYAADGDKLLLSRETRDISAGTESSDTYDGKGRLVQTIVRRGDEILEQTSQSWSDEGLLLSRSRNSALGYESWTWTWDDTGSMSSELYEKERLPIKKTTWDGSSRVEELYLRGEAILRVYYENSVRVKEEDISHGKVVRVRNYQTPKP